MAIALKVALATRLVKSSILLSISVAVAFREAFVARLVISGILHSCFESSSVVTNPITLTVSCLQSL